MFTTSKTSNVFEVQKIGTIGVTTTAKVILIVNENTPERKLRVEHYLIPYYQRGYRWEIENVKALLDDIHNFIDSKEEFYCLQPFVVVPNLDKNGLRIYPYGERGEDPLKMDNRKAQGTARYIGTRESIGYIDVFGENKDLTETSSRGDGLSKTSAYNQLYGWFYTTLRRLERYIIDVSDWGKDLSEDDYINLDEHSRVIALQELVSKLSKSKNIISIEYGDDLLNLLESKQENSAKSVLSDIKEKINNDNFDKIEILKGIEKAEKKISTLEKIKDDADNAALEEFIKNEKLTNDLEEERKKGSWQGALIGTDKERIIGLQHQIFHSSSRINRNIKLLLKHLNPNDLDENVKKYISVISLEASKINSIANFVTKANFNLKASEIEKDLIEFIIGYIDEIYISERSNIIPLDILIQNIIIGPGTADAAQIFLNIFYNNF